MRISDWSSDVCSSDLSVALDIALELRRPIAGIRLGNPSCTTCVMLMPEAAVDEDDLAAGAEDDVGFARQILAMQPEAVAQGMDHPSDKQFRRRADRKSTRLNSSH